jgi:membrane protein implicated in regulation of membrane protease activity
MGCSDLNICYVGIGGTSVQYLCILDDGQTLCSETRALFGRSAGAGSDLRSNGGEMKTDGSYEYWRPAGIASSEKVVRVFRKDGKVIAVVARTENGPLAGNNEADFTATTLALAVGLLFILLGIILVAIGRLYFGWPLTGLGVLLIAFYVWGTATRTVKRTIECSEEEYEAAEAHAPPE